MARIHFVGISGVGVNALAKFAAEMGFEVSGSDSRLSPLAKELDADIREGVCAHAVDGADMLVHTLAAGADHPEISRARVLGIPVVARHVMLCQVAKLFERDVAVAGTHGKTTTTAMLTHILFHSHKKFAAMIGGECVDFSNFVNNNIALDISEDMRRGFISHCAGEDVSEYCALRDRLVAGGGIFVTEACEYKRGFLQLRPYIGVVTNVDFDHPDCYSSQEDVRAAFDEFLAGCRIKVTEDGAGGTRKNAHMGADIAKTRAEASGGYTVAIEGSGLSETLTLTAAHEVYVGKTKACKLGLPMGGEYNFHNAMFAIAAAYALGISPCESASALSSFAGVKRRFERAGSMAGVPVYFDFAHHPTEIACALERAREAGSVLAVFQPHTFSRTKAYLDDFARVLGEGDGALVLAPTYAARESIQDGVGIDALEARIRERYPTKLVFKAKDLRDVLQLANMLAPLHGSVLMLGAGDIYSLRDSAKNGYKKL